MKQQTIVFKISDNLKDKVKELGSSEKMLNNVPIPFSFKDNFITAIIGNKKCNYTLLRNIITQLVTFHSYDDLKLVVFSTKEKIHNFDDYKFLPHFFSNDRNVRFMSEDND